MMETYTDAYNIYYDEDMRAVVMEWNGYATSEQFQEGTEIMLKTLTKNNAKKVLANIKNMILIGMEDQQWLDTNFIPRAIESGFTAIAIVKPDNYFNRVAVESISYKIDKDKLAVSFFDNLTDAKCWIKTN